MKKKIILVLSAAILISIGIYSSSYVAKTKDRELKRPELSDKMPVGFDSAYIESLRKVGFNTSKDIKLFVYTKQRQYWKSKYGLNFMGDEEMKQFLSDNNFIMGEASRFTKQIPVKEGKIMIENFNKISNQGDFYLLTLIHENITYELSADELKIKPETGASIRWSQWIGQDETMKRVVKETAVESRKMHYSDFWELTAKPKEQFGIMIISSQKDFNTDGMNIIEGMLTAPTPKDPIAVVKVKDGYVEISNWE